jgi:hypothetical protein
VHERRHVGPVKHSNEGGGRLLFQLPRLARHLCPYASPL